MDIEIIKSGPAESSLEKHIKEVALREQATKARALFEALDIKDLEHGLSFLDLKNDSLLSYMIEICNIVLLKAKGCSIKDHPSVERCVEYRVILEKIKGVDQRLAYQINNLISRRKPENIELDNLDVEIGQNSDVYEPPKLKHIKYKDTK